MSHSPSPPTCCLVVLSDSLYFPGTLALIHSFQSHNPKIPVILLSDDRTILEPTNNETLFSQRRFIDPESYEQVRPYKKRKSQRHARTFYKFEAFGDFGYERNVFLDSDILCLKPAPLLFEEYSAPLSAVKDSGFKQTRGYKGSPQEINSGVLLINKAIQGTNTIERLKQIAIDSPGRGGYNAADQGIINKWIRHDGIELNLLPEDYNLIKKDYSDTSELESCRLLHYCAGKPWFEAMKDRQEPLLDLWRNR